MRSVLEVREPRRIISAVTGLTGSGRAGVPGVSAPPPVSERTEILAQNIDGGSALRRNTGARCVIQPGLKRLGPVLETQSATLTVLLTDTGRAGHAGEPAAGLVVEELVTEIDPATNLSMEDGTVEDNQTIAGDATLPAVRFRTVGNLGAKEEIFWGEESAVSLRIQNGTNVRRVKGTVTLMQVVLEVLSVDVTTAGCIMEMPHRRMTAVRLAEVYDFNNYGSLFPKKFFIYLTEKITSMAADVDNKFQINNCFAFVNFVYWQFPDYIINDRYELAITGRRIARNAPLIMGAEVTERVSATGNVLGDKEDAL